ncbi:MAG: RNA polymerase sigma factor [Fibrobacterota bacterium]
MSESIEITETPDDAIGGVAGTDDEDLRLIALIREGDRIAFDRLIVKYQRKIITLCTRMLGNETDGEDAAQDTFVKVYNNLASFGGRSKFSTWLYTIALNTCKNSGASWWSMMWKKSVKLDRTVVDDDGNESPRDLKDTKLMPSKDLERKRKMALLENAIAKLPKIHRELIILRDYEEKRYDEIAVIAGVSEGTVKSRLARARAALEVELKGVLDEI